MSGPYDDIMDLPHHVSPTRPRMSMLDRAAQFSPFAALTGFDEAVEETARLTDERLEPSEERLKRLDRQLRALAAAPDHPSAVFTYFCPDAHKSGGAYQSVTGTIRKLDLYHRRLVLHNGATIPLDEIVDILPDAEWGR